MNSGHQFLVTVEEVHPNQARRAVFPNVHKKLVSVEADIIGEALEEFVESFSPILDRLAFTNKSFAIDEIEVALGLDASGKISIIGELGSTFSSSFKLRFKKIN